MTQGKVFTTLYKKTSTGAIQYWFIKTNPNFYTPEVWDIVTEFGQLGTDSPQVTFDTIKTGKNPGKKNATTCEQQANKEAQGKWEKQLKKGYVKTVEDARDGHVDAIIEGGVIPMLAHKFSEQGHKIKYPAYVQPKLDGIRCVAILSDGKCTLWSRTRKAITGVPHISRHLEQMFPAGTLVLDGELYNHDLKSDFEKIVSMVRQEEPAEGHEIVQYHIYDLIKTGPFSERTDALYQKLPSTTESLVRVATMTVENEDELMTAFELFTKAGYEGAMVRNSDGQYVNKRSYDLLKIKEFQDAEFPIIGVEEGRGKLQGHAAAFICRTPEGGEFRAKLKGSTEMLQKYFEDKSMWRDKYLTVKFQGLTNKNGVPRFPVGVAVRDYE